MAIKKVQIVPPGYTDILHPETDSTVVYMSDGTTTLHTAYNNLLNGNTAVAKANALATARTITLTGAVTGSINFDGSGNVSLATTLSATANADTLDSQHGSYYLNRTNHTGSQSASTISDFASTVRSVALTGISLATNAVISATDTILTALGKLQKQISDNLATLTGHTGNTSNPHGVTKGQVGLGNVDNTSDATKNVLSATKLTTARTINGVSFNGESNITITAEANGGNADKVDSKHVWVGAEASKGTDEDTIYFCY